MELMDLLHTDTMDIYQSQLSNIRFKAVNNYHKDLAAKLKTNEETLQWKNSEDPTLLEDPV